MKHIKYQKPANHWKGSDGRVTVSGWSTCSSIRMTVTRFREWRRLGYPWLVFSYDRAIPTTDKRILISWQERRAIPQRLADGAEFG